MTSGDKKELIKNICYLNTKYYFKEKMKSNNINLILLPAAEPLYNVNNWWKSEQGLIFVNNEYLKIIWYLTHY
jgi:hypothetical protein